MLEPRERTGGDPPLAGDPFDGTRYRLMKRLAEGGMGEVYLVEHRVLGGVFVAKVLRPELVSDARVVERMRVEAQSLGTLNHPNIVTIAAFDRTADGRPFHVLERLRGRTLQQEMAARGYIPVLETVDYACQVLSALRAVHKVGIVHRDIKPDNIFLHDQLGGPRILKVLDFGIVRILPSASRTAPKPSSIPTEAGTVVGTPRFMSPEAALGESVDPRADLYATGLVLYMLLAGRGPFDELKTDEKLLKAHATEDPLPPSHFARGPVPPELDRAVLRALAKDPADRFQTAQEFAKVLGEIRDALMRPLGWSETIAFSKLSKSEPRASPPPPANADVAPATLPIPRSEVAEMSLLETPDEPPDAASPQPPRVWAGPALRTLARATAFIVTAALTAGVMVWLGRWIGK